MSNFDIPKEEARRIFEETILPQMTEGFLPQDTQEAFIIGGQPGSGKSAFAREILKKKRNVVFINGDDLRAYHPKYYFYLKQNDIEAADLTQAVCNFWIEELIKACAGLHFDIMVEGTMRRVGPPMSTAKLLRENKYEVGLVTISTPYELSLLSLEARYKEIKKLGGFARYTKKENHDEAFRSIEANVKALSEPGIFRQFHVYTRRMNSFERKIFMPEEKAAMLAKFREGRQRRIDENEKEASYKATEDKNFEIR